MLSHIRLVGFLLLCWETSGRSPETGAKANKNQLGPPRANDCLCDAHTHDFSSPINTNYPLKACTGSCNVAFQGDCFCTRENHPTGCTIKDCEEDDGPVLDNYSCYCTATHAPVDCVARPNTRNPLCVVDRTVVNKDCQCDTESHDPDNCNIRVCNPNEVTGRGYRCLCGDTCDRKPDGCGKASFNDDIISSADAVIDMITDSLSD
ncbi:unnamed protein product [Orchesella dallaii]|uniref:Uncharacterized protein n=1 Tax=Orchesella dallaii TaxID=48710 RepID=A0ABP1RGS8_9HEXA